MSCVALIAESLFGRVIDRPKDRETDRKRDRETERKRDRGTGLGVCAVLRL